MHAAPPVSLDLASCRLERALIAVLHALAFGVGAAWCQSLATRSPAPWWLVAAVLGATVGWLSACALLPRHVQRLQWTGAAWQLGNAPAFDRLDLQLDLGPWMLLCTHGPQPRSRQWVVASAGAAEAEWHALRVAVQAHAGRAVPPDNSAVAAP